jgi:hypothetical protein
MPKYGIEVNLWLQDAVEEFLKEYVLENRIKKHPQFKGINPEWIELSISYGCIEVSWAFREYSHQWDDDWIKGTEVFLIGEALKLFLNSVKE